MSSLKPAPERCLIALREFFDDRLGAALARRSDDFVHLVRRLDLAKAMVSSRCQMLGHKSWEDEAILWGRSGGLDFRIFVAVERIVASVGSYNRARSLISVV